VYTSKDNRQQQATTGNNRQQQATTGNNRQQQATTGNNRQQQATGNRRSSSWRGRRGHTSSVVLTCVFFVSFFSSSFAPQGGLESCSLLNLKYL
jgi:hypothetical protein